MLLLGFVATLLIGSVFLMWQTIAAERSQREQADRTSSVLLALRDISSEQSLAAPVHHGFGSSLIDGSARQLGGTIEREFQPRENTARIAFPLGA